MVLLKKQTLIKTDSPHSEWGQRPVPEDRLCKATGSQYTLTLQE